jgi:GGDEF domain-containing protein/EAL domain-containing protein (putative c-di-GMP-specific phosphodiesterase class I)
MSNASSLSIVLLLVLLVAVAIVAVFVWRAWRALVEQAQALEQGRLIELPEATYRWMPGLRPLARSLNGTVHRLRVVFASQAEQVGLLQRQAQLDAVTGLPLRQHFIGQLHQLLATDGQGVALLLVRVQHLDALNPRIGHELTDRLLHQIASLLLTYVDRVPGTFAGRLNGSDFALCLPVAGVGLETAQSLRETLAAAPALRSAGAEVVLGGADGLHRLSASSALAAADAALARAEHDAFDGGLVVEQHGIDSDRDPTGPAYVGASAWRAQIGAALAEGRARLAEFDVRSATGELIHVECPLLVQLVAGGDYHAADRWLALARRSQLLPQVDLAAIELALKAIRADGRPRAVHVAAASLASAQFVAGVAQRLVLAPQGAARLSIDCVQSLRSTQDPTTFLALLSGAVVAWRPFGVRVGIEHAGASPQELPGLQTSGISYVKVDARHLRGAASDMAVRGYASSLLALIHGLGWMALAEGIDEPEDLATLWSLGYDGATGPALAAVASR